MAAIFQEGSFDDVGVTFQQALTFAIPGDRDEADVAAPTRLSLRSVQTMSFAFEPPKLNLLKSDQNWSLYITDIRLNASFEGWLRNMFNPVNQVYFTSVAWDYSGSPLFVYPPKGTDGDKFLIPLHEGQSRKFVGDGVQLWPPSKVTGGLNIALVVFESDSEVRKVGERLSSLHEAVGKSQLWSLVSAISAAPQLATAVAVAKAVDELVGLVGGIMKGNGDDYVDMFNGTFGVEKPQKAGVRAYQQEAASIQIDLDLTDAPNG